MADEYVTRKELERECRGVAIGVGLVLCLGAMFFCWYPIRELKKENTKINASLSNFVQRVDYYRGTNAPYSTNLVDSAEGVRK
jgi:hypothetical protein